MAAEGGGGGDVGRADGCKKTPWTHGEDEALRCGVREYGPKSWDAIALALPGRASKSCRLRWCQHLSPELDNRPFMPEEDEEIIRRQHGFSNKWATIARYLTGRSDNAVKNWWNSTLRKQLLGAHDTEDAPADDDQAVRVCLQLFPVTAGFLKEEAEAATAAYGDVATDLALGLPGLGEASAVDLSLSL